MKTRPLAATCLALAPYLSLPAQAAGAIATAATNHGSAYYWVADQPGRAAAEIAALEKCKAHAQEDRQLAACRLDDSADGPNYWAVVVASNGGIGWAYRPDRQQAIDNAYRHCVKHSGGRCAGTAAAVWFDKGQEGVPAATAKAPPKPDAQAPQPISPPSGKWSRIAGSTEVQYYVDKPTLIRTGDIVTAWVLYSMADESIANLNEHNCKTQQYRTLAWKHFSASMGEGESVEGEQQAEPWRSVTLDAFYAGAMHMLCHPAQAPAHLPGSRPMLFTR